ncbi:MAG: sulfotransferase [Pseudomonadota bacterium]
MRPRPNPLTRAPLVEKSNAWLSKAWAKGWLPEPTLDPAALWAVAAKPFGSDAELVETTGRDSRDVADFRLRLSKLTEAAQAEARLNPLGRAMGHGQLVRVIRQRLGMGKKWAEHTDLPRTDIAPPIIVIGHMRAGTTRVHKLLAADPAHSSTRFCDAWHPVPAKPDMRAVKSAIDLAIMRRINPWIDAIHPMATQAVEEELSWLAAALNHSVYQTQWHIPSYSGWSEARDPAPVYREFGRILRTDSAYRGVSAKPRVLKVPTFSEDLPSLLAEFPDARLIIAQRDSEDVLRSAVSLVANLMTISSDHCDLGWIETEWRRKLALRDERMASFVDHWDGPIAHLQFDALGEDWESEIARTYQALDLELSGKALLAMRKEMVRSKSGQHLSHSEHLSRFAMN